MVQIIFIFIFVALLFIEFNINQLRLVSINQKSKPIICLWNENIRGRLPVACQKHCVVFPLNPLQEINLTVEKGFRSKV